VRRYIKYYAGDLKMKVSLMNTIDIAKPGSRVVSLISTRLLKNCFFRLLKNAQMQGPRNPEE